MFSASAASNRLVTLAGRNVTRKVTEVTLFVTHYGIYYGIYYGFLDHIRMLLCDAVHGFPAGSDTHSRPHPLLSAVETGGAQG